MRYTIWILLIIVFASCFPRVRPVKETYVDPPFKATSSLAADAAFDKVVSLFNQKGVTLKVKDKASGSIVSARSVLITTIEDKSGKLMNKSAWIVVPSVYNPYTKTLSSQYTGKVLGEWNISIKGSGKGSNVNVSVLNLKRQFTAYKMGEQETDASFAKSTGVFEKLIADAVR